MPKVSIVILCHNDGKYLKGCLRGIRRHTDSRKTPYELILINNNTRDGSGPFLRRLARQRDVRLIENERNQFFAGGNNQGIRIARGEFVLLLNADTLMGPGWLERLIACAQRDPRIGLVAPCTNGAVGHQLVPSPGYSAPKRFFSFAVRWASKHGGEWKEAHRVIGFCMLIKRRVIEEIGLLDERFGPGGYEDYDYCIRVRQGGYRLAVALDVYLHHFGGKGYVGMDYDRLRARNREILVGKWCGFAMEALDQLDRYLDHSAPFGRKT